MSTHIISTAELVALFGDPIPAAAMVLVRQVHPDGRREADAVRADLNALANDMRSPTPEAVIQRLSGELGRLRGVLEEVRDSYGVNHTSSWAKQMAEAAVGKRT